MTYKLTHSLLIIFKPLCGFILALGLIGCSNSKTDSAHHTDHAHGEEHADGTLTHSETATNSATDTHNDDHNDEAHSTIRSAESHVHGGAILSIVSERNKIAIEFETPIYNLLGFEYAPQTPAEKARVQDVEKTLAAPASLIRFNKEAKCDYAAPDSQIKLFDEHADDPEHDEEHHDEEHHDDDNDDTHEKAGSHKDLIVTFKTKEC